ncbi:ATM1-type heavy metal exporter [Candidatus Phycosocius bacilliformis]|uniref:ATM1-type heavy metal exporter n=1 Tax=Candidatus Phycosocius bacilliformis TaxID=1445552 RepID=A0A2P2ECC3_9PROT|nr:ABC transporter ATP-binding protein [Candidatus Phycosocius bacilliformis]GBF58703.1 ATM1-type heavy metal exporter [Candidatus Phycosocius bacilliformis]
MTEYFDDEDDATTRQQKARIGQIMAYLWAHWTSQPIKFVAVIVLMMLATACELVLPALSGKIVEALTEGPLAAGRAFDLFGLFAAVAAGMFILRNVLVRIWNRFASRNMANITKASFADVQRFSSQWHSDNFAGATVRRVSRAMWAYDVLSDNFLWFILPAAIVLLGLTGIMLANWPLIGLYVGVSISIFTLASILMARYHIQEANERSNSADTAIGAALADAVSANPTVKAFGAEAREEARFGAVVEKWRALVTTTWMRYVDGWALSNTILWALQVGLLGLVLIEWKEGRASPGDATFALTSYFLIASYLRNLGETVQQIQRGFADIEDAVAYSLEVEDVADASDARAFVPGPGEIVFDQVSFAYRGQSEPLYQDFSLTIRPGETVALVGQTGSGKSTFVKLLQRLYDVDAGAIRIDGQDVRTVRQDCLRAAIALVPQDPALFHRTLRENIAYARPDASDADVTAAIADARADAFISRLPKGLETQVGERGVKLSGGERQRVALARAFLADARILILDEATSSLDTQTERDVQDAMKSLAANKTTILIAHRLSTVREADRILVFEAGRIVEQGTHDSLVAAGGAYARLNALSIGDKLGGALDLHAELSVHQDDATS